MSTPPKILAFAASSSRNSINFALAHHAAQVFAADIMPGAEVETLDLNDFEMPIYSIDREKEGGIPEKAHAFLARIGEADALIIGFAEHNGTYSVAFKNVFDWASRIQREIWQEKPIVALATSPGARGAQTVLGFFAEGAHRFAGNVVASVSVPKFNDCFDRDSGKLTDKTQIDALTEALEALKDHMKKAA